MKKPRGRNPAGSPGGFRRILVPVDFTAGSEQALQAAAGLAAVHRARILPLHVVPPSCFTADCGYGPVNRQVEDTPAMHRTRARLERLIRKWVPEKFASPVVVRSGQPVPQIVSAARDLEADLIVMLAHDLSRPKAPRPTFTVDRLVREAGCPVLVIHARGSARSPGDPARQGNLRGHPARLRREPP